MDKMENVYLVRKINIVFNNLLLILILILNVLSALKGMNVME